MPIVTLKSMTKPLNALYVRYDGVFVSGNSYRFLVNDYRGTDKISLVYMSTVGQYTGLMDRNFSETDCLSDGNITVKYGGLTYTYTPHYRQAIFPFVMEDNNGEFILGFKTTNPAYYWSIVRVDSAPTTDGYGYCTIIKSPDDPVFADEYYNPTISALVKLWLTIPTYPDPYSPGGASTHGGGGRSFDNTSDPVALPSLPADPVLNSGFVTMYQMDVLKLNSLANFLWNESLFDTKTWQKVMANPFDAIISLNYIPASPNVLSDRSIQIGNVTTNVSAAPVADQFVQIDCQTLDVEEYGGTYLDYNPYTKVEIYLPYIGFRDLNTDEVMDKTLHLIYNVDIVTGTCVANILVDNTVLYQFTGNCALSIPLTGRDAGKNFAALLSLISAGAVVGAGAASGTLDAAGAVKAVSATAQAVMGAKRNIQRSGSVSGAAGFMGGQTPYLIITRPRQALPESQNSFTGYPSFITENLSDLAGFTTIESIHLEGIPGTSAEIAEIESLLSSGVIL